MIRTHQHAAEQDVTSDPHDEMSPQKIYKRPEKCANLAELETCCKMNIHSQKSASIEPTTSPPKFGKLMQIVKFSRLSSAPWKSAPANSRALKCSAQMYTWKGSHMLSGLGDLCAALIQLWFASIEPSGLRLHPRHSGLSIRVLAK